MKKGWTIALIALLFSIFISACGSAGNKTETSDKNVLRIAEMEEFTSIDPATVVDGGSFILANHIYEGLMRIGKDKKPVEGIAKEYTVSPDKRTYTFKLRDAKWSDGKPITAKDFEFGWKRVLNPATKSEYAYILFPIDKGEEFYNGKAKEQDVGVKAIDDKTLQVTLKTPMINFLDYTILPAYLPQRPDMVEKLKNDPFRHPDQIVYSGPFILKSFQASKIVLAKNDKYWDQKNVHLQQVDLHVLKDVGTAINLYNTGQVDITPLNSAFIDRYKDSPDLIKAERATSIYMVMNQRQKFTQNVNIRRAISLALNRQVIADRILKDGSQPAHALVHPSIAGLGSKSFREATKKDLIPYDPAKAKEYFQRGLKELGMSQPPEKVVLLTGSYYSNIAAVIKEQLRVTLGLNVVIETPTAKVVDDRKERGDFDLTISAWGADYNDAMAYLELFNTNENKNSAGFKSDAYNQLIVQARQETDQTKRIEMLSRAEKMLVDEQVVLAPIYFRYSVLLKKPYVKNYYTHPIGADYSLKWVKLEK
ncbi:peptide ABC transporter substrate-binding protein [Thermoflavimicrobium dichotomicum]|uniref:Oligopeptide transport system substrate-binding protein n=1 Tax=Thermoflavimicrobium dichotomicum TaxID=46223 RepID=A0A1I3TTS1_9BACL|nr:peptide ABC transporter substrate-binding protein [Thermoflavimicrobium dichotomicum]SFJ73739.1 oligopeptide transport system substrate-binding protein [Thermoflavimicrobium dichotomicum]